MFVSQITNMYPVKNQLIYGAPGCEVEGRDTTPRGKNSADYGRRSAPSTYSSACEPWNRCPLQPNKVRPPKRASPHILSPMEEKNALHAYWRPMHTVCGWRWCLLGVESCCFVFNCTLIIGEISTVDRVKIQFLPPGTIVSAACVGG